MTLSDFVDAGARARFLATYDAAMGELWPPHERHEVPTRSGPTAAYSTGSSTAPPVVLLPGGSSNATSWAPLLPSLLPRYRVIAVDLIGEAGRSRQHAPIPDAAARAAWLEDTLAGLGVERAHVVGLSAGGAIALNQAVHLPRRLVSVSALEPARVLAPLRAGFVLRTLRVLLTRSPGAASAFLGWVGGHTVDLSSPTASLAVAALTEYRTRAVPPPPRVPASALRSIDLPTLVLLGADSGVHDARRAAARAALVPRAEVHVLAGAGHGVFTDRPEEVGALLGDFLRRADGG